jgi:glycosyltransferase 2 family protein
MSVKKIAVLLLKLIVSLGIIVYLVIQAQGNDVFADLASRPKNWGLLAAATVVCFLVVVISLVRWYYLVRALDIPFTLRDALRLGFLGYLFNLAPTGVVGGDMLKAVVLARANPGRRAEAVASVFVDRVIGLYVAFLVASVAVGLTGFWQIPGAGLHRVAECTLAITALGTVAVALPLVPDLSRGATTRWIGRMPYGGPHLLRFIEAVRMYRLKLPVLLGSTLMTVAAHSLFAVGVWFIARGLYDNVPTMGEHFVIAPISATTGAIPFFIGPFEFVINWLYPRIPLAGGLRMMPGQGLIVALCYRIISVLCAIVGIGYYFSSRAEVVEAMHDAKLQPAGDVAARA